MPQEEMMTMEQLLQLYEGLHGTISRNELIIKAICFGFALVILLICGLCEAIVNGAETTVGVALLSLLGLYFLTEGWFLFKRLKAEISESKTMLKTVVAMIAEYRQTLSGMNPVFLKAIDLRLQRL
jgi:putative Mn2+ efflux pump MntP